MRVCAPEKQLMHLTEPTDWHPQVAFGSFRACLLAREAVVNVVDGDLHRRSVFRCSSVLRPGALLAVLRAPSAGDGFGGVLVAAWSPAWCFGESGAMDFGAVLAWSSPLPSDRCTS